MTEGSWSGALAVILKRGPHAEPIGQRGTPTNEKDKEDVDGDSDKDGDEMGGDEDDFDLDVAWIDAYFFYKLDTFLSLVDVVKGC
jgi:hypothetical protein